MIVYKALCFYFFLGSVMRERRENKREKERGIYVKSTSLFISLFNLIKQKREMEEY